MVHLRTRYHPAFELPEVARPSFEVRKNLDILPEGDHVALINVVILGRFVVYLAVSCVHGYASGSKMAESNKLCVSLVMLLRKVHMWFLVVAWAVGSHARAVILRYEA